MSNSQDNKYEKILDYLEVLTKSLNEFKSDVDRRFDAVDKRFDAVDEDMGTLKGTTRRIEERQALAEKSIGILQEADRARLTHLQDLLDEGIASGVSPLSVEAVFANAKAKYDRQSML